MKKTLFFTGIFIIVTTHIYMLVFGLSSSQINSHSILNLIASGLLIGSKYLKLR